jgi:MerR family transcriptional regulator, heat shock protein HspR
MDERATEGPESQPVGADDRDAGDGPEGTTDRGVYIISVAAELVGVHPQTLRIYERKGLLQPSRTAGNTRRYSDRDIARLQTIQRLTQEGVNLAGVKMIVRMENELDLLRRRMDAMRREVERAERRLLAELEQARRENRAAIVPVSQMRRFERPQPPQARRRPIVAGPSQERRGPIAMGPGT